MPRERPSIMMPGYGAGRRPGNYGQKYPPTLLQPSEVTKLMDVARGGLRAYRIRALIAVLYRSGCLLNEALNLRLQDVDAASRTLRFVGGRQMSRTVGMDERAFEVLDEWLTARSEIPGDLVFCTYTGRAPGAPIHPNAIRETLRELAEKADLSAMRIHPGAFRHSLAADLLVEGWPLPYIQAQLGIVTLYAMERFLKNLEIRPPSEPEVIAVIHTRSWDL
jgi:site-specific recombinase XerD